MSLPIRVLMLLLVIGCWTAVQAQNPGIQVGFAIVTVESGNSAGIVPFETLVETGSGGTTTTNITPPPLLTNSSMVVSLGADGNNSTGIAIVNATATAGHVQLSV